MDRALEIAQTYPTLLAKYGITTPLRKANFFGQLSVESDLKPIAENMNYSAKRLTEIFPKYFPTTTIANQYANHPALIGARVYGGRMGNGIESTGDGYKYRGRGFLQITGADNYKQLTKDTGIDFTDNPDKLLEEDNALIAALWFWNKAGLNKYADLDDVVTISKKINGGTIGLSERKTKVAYYKQIFK